MVVFGGSTENYRFPISGTSIEKPHFLGFVLSIISDLIHSAKSSMMDARVSEVLVGLHWTAVTSRHTGLAATHADAPCCYARDVEGCGRLQERSVKELLEFLYSNHPLEVSIGMAALNSLKTASPEDGIEVNAKDLLMERSQGKKVAVIGHFPFAESLRKMADALWVLELDPAPGEYPASTANLLLPQADIIGMTATTLMNGTFDDLYKLFPPEALVVMIGPSTPLDKVLFDYGVDILAGSLVTDARALFRYIGQGTTLHKVEGLRRFTIARDGLLNIRQGG